MYINIEITLFKRRIKVLIKSKGVMYSQSFGVSLMVLTLITTVVILAVTSNVVLSLGMVGALSIDLLAKALAEE